MAAQVLRKLEERLVPSPLTAWCAPTDGDSARHIEILDFLLEFRFRHSLGRCSRFFLALEERTLIGARCPACGHVWMPPRAFCGNDGTVTEWIELDGKGSLAGATVCSYTLKGPIGIGFGSSEATGVHSADRAAEPFVLGYVALQGASTLLLQRIRSFGDVKRLTAGLPLKVAWATAPVEHPMELFWFEPLHESENKHPQAR